MRRAAWGLAAGVAVLLSAGVVAAATVDSSPSAPVPAGGRVGLAGIGQERLEEPAVTAAPSTVPVAIMRPTSSTTPGGPPSTRPSTTTTTTTRPPTTTTTLAPVPAGHLLPASSWQVTMDGVHAKVRIEPAAPVAGQPVRFLVEFTGGDDCCYVFLHFGDDERFALNNDWMCAGESPLTPGTHTTTATHTYAKPGAYRMHLQVLDGDLCTLPRVHPEGEPVPLHNLDLYGCLAVGPGTAGAAGCPPPMNLLPFGDPLSNR